LTEVLQWFDTFPPKSGQNMSEAIVPYDITLLILWSFSPRFTAIYTGGWSRFRASRFRALRFIRSWRPCISQNAGLPRRDARPWRCGWWGVETCCTCL